MTTAKPQPILHTIQTGGSGTGHGYYSRYASSCPLSASLDFSSTFDSGITEKSGRGLGTIAHAMHELRWKKILDPKNAAQLTFVEFSQHVDEENRNGAERVVRYFNEVLPEDDALGDVLEVESSYPERDPKTGNLTKEGVGQAAVLEDLYSLPFTFRVDLITRLNKKQVTRLKNNGALSIGGPVDLKPVKTLWDYKHYGRREGNTIDKAIGSTQYAAYVQAYNLLHPDDPIEQTVQVSIFTTKDIGIWLTVVPISEHIEKVAAQLIRMGSFVADNELLITLPSESNCFPYGGLCRHLKDSKCDRLGPTNLGLVQLKNAGLLED